ncbi:hypothetical protein [Sulfitobacter geojensis]|uniref:Glycosyltransferase 2-like domain-containing protein n=1 Tax=Sulfitobacter geojensis TaxID=1342299 RepID=A0AAE2VXD9_9RHOB|nr:hypothetical protein [Sulfitobacter geojensis]MBM1689168.1 hypothetical protein [Sulfitobacter geojensis]MBM1693235.1 hypothetical protein [Sulfitobacter geojensis]MBM1705401.1 hypothetical protein [Sulfitobacter geojensis]MBM1709459.1 hypothetical protein [Sulfitobacter geojensis]MBM1713524.1 hypothetical protein [Sulfitobacter geojensis]
MTSFSLRIPIVVACYDRPLSLKRVLASLCAANYLDQPVNLTISIDCSDVQDSLIEVAEAFEWPFGVKTIRAFDRRQGLRSHILQCGDLSIGEDGIIVLEDDLIVGENFYRFAVDAIAAVGADDGIAGISLYAPTINEMVPLPFQPAPSGFDGYFLQSSQSWGQCWTTSMWKAFREWYRTAASPLSDDGDMPSRIYSWPETSWKKYHMKYTVEMGMTWLYPYVSHSSNCSDVGAHNPRPSFLFQVALSSGNREFLLPKRTDPAAVHYDAFFERSDFVDEDGVPLLLDLYGTRRSVPQGSRFVTGRPVSLIPVRGYGLLLRPHDENVARHISGDDMHAFDAVQALKLTGRMTIRKRAYHSDLSWAEALHVGIYGLRQAMPDKARRLIRQVWNCVFGRCR